MFYFRSKSVVSCLSNSAKVFGAGALLALSATSASATSFADQVLDYTPGSNLPTDYGTGAPYDVSASALGAPFGVHGIGTGFDSVLSPFSSAYELNEIVSVGEGGQLTLRLEQPVAAGSQRELGVFTNVGIADAAWPSGVANALAFAFGIDAVNVAVSANGVDFFDLYGGNPLLFDMPSNYFNNAGPYDIAAPVNPDLADFGLPNPIADFSFFDGASHADIVAELAGSAGGTWLDIESSGLSQVGFVRFSVPNDGDANTFLNFDLDAVSINASQAIAVPEPGALMLMGVVGVAAAMRRKR